MAKSNKFDYSDEKTCVFQIFFVTLCAEIEMKGEQTHHMDINALYCINAEKQWM